MRYPEFHTPEEVTLMKKALQCIETLCEYNCLGAQKLSDHPVDCKWCQIYSLAHAGTSPSCRDSHPTWETDIEKLHKELA